MTTQTAKTKTTATFKPRACDRCAADFTPASGRAKYCQPCRIAMRRQFDRDRYHTAKRLADETQQAADEKKRQAERVQREEAMRRAEEYYRANPPAVRVHIISVRRPTATQGLRAPAAALQEQL